MGLTEETVEIMIDTGCTACGSKRLTFQTYVDGRFVLQGGERVSSLVWVYDGEKFVDGIFEIVCASCQHVVFQARWCPRCHAEDGLARALAATNRFPVPRACPSCHAEEVRYIAMMPAAVTYEGKRAEKPRANFELEDPGFHGYRVDCASCGTVAELRDRCPLCDAPGPLRVRPG
jgi:hypothetical protein